MVLVVERVRLQVNKNGRVESTTPQVNKNGSCHGEVTSRYSMRMASVVMVRLASQREWFLSGMV